MRPLKLQIFYQIVKSAPNSTAHIASDLYHLTYGEYFKLLLTPWIAQCHCYCHQKMPGPPQTVVVYNRRVEMIVLAVRSQRRQVLLCFIVDIYRY